MSLDRLVAALGALPGVAAQGQWEGSEWTVFLNPDYEDDDGDADIIVPTEDAWLSLMFVVYGVRSMPDAHIRVSAFPPLLNPAPDVWMLVGTADTDELASLIDTLHLVPLDEWPMDAGEEDE